MSVTNPSDYIGKFNISKNLVFLTELQNTIDSVELTVFNQLFGIDLYALYLQGIEDDEEIYTKLFDPFFFEKNGRLFESKGIAEMMKGFVYYANFVQTTSEASTNGNVKSNPENSNIASDVLVNIYLRNNESVKTYKAIQEYILSNLDVYPTFKGIAKKYIIWF